MKTPVLITLAATIVAVGGLITFLIVTDRDPALLVTALVIAVPLIGNLFLTQKTVTQTNGNLSKLQDTIARQRAIMTPEQLAQLELDQNPSTTEQKKGGYFQ